MIDNNTPLSPSEESDLAQGMPYLLGAPPVTQATQAPPSIMGRIAEQAANLPSNIGSSLLNLVGNVAQIGTPDADRTSVNLPTPYNIPQATTLGEKAVDVGSNLVAQLPSYLLPELAVGKLAGAAGVAGTVSKIAGGVASGYLNSTQDGQGQALEQGGILGAMAGLGTLGRAARLLPTLGLAAGAGALTYQQTGDTTAALTNAGILGTLGMLHAGPETTSEITPTVTQERGIVPYNPGKGFTMGAGTDPGTVININEGRYRPQDWTQFGGNLPDTETLRLQDQPPLTPGNLLLDRDNPRGFTQGDVTSQPDNTQGRFTLGADTTQQPNNGLAAPTQPLQLLGPSDDMPATKNVTPPATAPADTHNLVLPPGKSSLSLQLPEDQAQIVSTAYRSPDGKNVYVGKNWNDGHDLIPLTHGMWDDANDAPVSPTQDQRGFIVHNGDGTQTFENRNDALQIAKQSGQAPADLDPPLNSTDLIDRSAPAPEKGNQGSVAPILPPADVTSHSTPDPIIAPAKDSTDVAPTPTKQEAPQAIQPPPADPVAATPGTVGAKSTAPDPQLQQVDPVEAATPPSELPPSKGVAALSGDDQLLTDSTGHMSPLDQEDMQYYREQHAKYSDPTGDDYSPEDAQTQLDRMQDVTTKYAGGADNPPVPVTSSDMAIARADANAKANLENTGTVLKASSGGKIVTSQAPKLIGAAEDAWSSMNHLGDQPDAAQAIPVPSFSEDPEGNDKATVQNIVDQLQVPDYDPDYKPSAEDEAAVKAQLPADDTLDDDAKTADDASASETDKLGGLMDLLKTDSSPEPVAKVKRLNAKSRRNQAGFVDRDMAGYIARYGVAPLVGGTVGASMDKENKLRGFIIGAASGFALGHMGPKALDFLMKDAPETVKAQGKILKDVTSQPGSQWEDTFQDLAAQDHGATSEGIANWARRFQRAFTMDDQARDMQGIANLSGIERASKDALDGMREGYDNLPADKKAIVDKFANEPMMRKEQYVDPADGKAKSRWAEKDMSGVYTKFTADMAQHPVEMGQAMKVKALRAQTQQIIAHSTFDSAFKEKLLSSIGEYHTDSYRIFMDSKYKPTQTQIEKAMDSIQWLKMYPSYDRPMLGKVLGSYLDEIYRNRGTFSGGGGSDSGSFNDILKRKGTMDADVAAKIIAAVPGAKSVDEIVTSQRDLPDNVKKLLADQIGKGNYMTPAYRDMLGYYDHPVEREAATLMKLMPAARAATMFRMVAEGTSERSGLPLSIDPDEVAQKRATLQAQLQTATDPKIRQALQVQLKDLRDRVLLPNTSNLGILSGRYVPPSMADMLPDMDKGVAGGNQFAVTQAIQNYNRVMKAGQTILNPINHLKWIYNAPILGALSGTGPGDILNGFKVALGNGENAAKLRRMQDLGIAETSIARSEFNTTAKQALGGTLDSSIVDKFFSNGLVSKAADAYGLSDNAIRIGTFMAREQQVLDRLAPDVLAGRVTSQEASAMAEKEAVSHTNRYTINYAVAPGGLAYIRKFPFVSLYLTYSYEMARITKNIAMDAMGKGPYGKAAVPGAITKLAALATIPAAIQAMSRAALSPADQKQWDQSIAMDQPYAQPRFRAVLGKRDDGSFKYVDFTAWVPTGDWNMFGRAVASGDWKQMVAANPILGTDNTPALNIATEIITGQDSRTGRPINTLGRTLDAARQEIAPAFIGGYEFDNLMRALQPNDDGANGGIGVSRMGSGKGYSWQDLLTTYATTLRPTSVNVDWQRKTTVAAAQSQISTERQFMMDTLATNMTADVKAQAVKRFQDAATVIIANMKAKIDNQ